MIRGTSYFKRSAFVAIFAAALFFRPAVAAAELPGGHVDLLMAAATDAELQPVLDRLESVRIESRAAWKFWRGTLAGKEVVLTRTEGDPLNAVVATTLAIRRYAPSLIVVFGAARAHDPALRPGDLVVSGKFAAFDGMVSPVMPLGGGSDPLTWEKLPHLLATVGEKETAAFSFPADAKALAVAETLAVSRGRMVVGTLGSAAHVNREADRIAWIRREWGTSTEDGESAHIAGCAQLLGIPVIGLRVVDGQEGEAGTVALHFVEAWKK